MRCLSLVFAVLAAWSSSAQEGVCRVGRQQYAILIVESIEAYGPYLEGVATDLTPEEVDRAECILERFIAWHNALTRTQRDLVADATLGRVRPECMIQDWPRYIRQYAGERTKDGQRRMHVNLMHPDGLFRESEQAWVFVNDGADNYFRVTVDLDREEVIQYSVNGPYPPGGWCE